MANRSYLYSIHEDEPKVRDLAEWKSHIPVAHYLLVGCNASAVRSEIWGVEEKVAVRGDGPAARETFLRFLDWLEPQLSGDYLAEDVQKTKELLEREDRIGSHYHVEPGEVYELCGYSLEEMAREAERDAATARAIYSEVKELLETSGSTIDDFKNAHLCDVAQDWQQGLGLYFTGILYFHLG